MTYRDPDYVEPTRDRVIVEREPTERVVEREPTERVVERPVVREVVDEHHVVAATSPVDTMRRIVWLVFGVLQALIVLRIVLLLLGANEGNDLVAFIVGITNPFVEPFRGMFRLDEVTGASGSVLDVAAIVALIAWTLVEALVLGLVGLADRRATTA
jgi:uncharacterized protein YggT (Ycf19 family)